MPTALNAESNNISDCPEILASSYCLNGATCFSVKIHNSVLYNCWCRSGFQGARCDYKYTLNRQAHLNEDTKDIHSLLQPGAHYNNQSAQQLLLSNRDSNKHQQGSIEPLNLGFVEVVKLQQEAVPASRQRLQTDKGAYLIVFCSLSFLFSILFTIWLIHKYLEQCKQPEQANSCSDSNNQQELATTPSRLSSGSINCTQSIAQASDVGTSTLKHQSSYQPSNYSIDLGCARIVESSNLKPSHRLNHLDRASAGVASIGLNQSCSHSSRLKAGRSSEKQLTNYYHTTDYTRCNNFHNNGPDAWIRRDNAQQPPPRGALYAAAELVNRPLSQPYKQQLQLQQQQMQCPTH